ncbi:uncharacterized protein [Notamacropus eugenii]|uniref:uncharacterized protein n=1 Tax=Notamacropus eugenii TaxID=9315 RepID=UPI003B680F15
MLPSRDDLTKAAFILPVRGLWVHFRARGPPPGDSRPLRGRACLGPCAHAQRLADSKGLTPRFWTRPFSLLFSSLRLLTDSVTCSLGAALRGHRGPRSPRPEVQPGRLQGGPSSGAHRSPGNTAPVSCPVVTSALRLLATGDQYIEPQPSPGPRTCPPAARPPCRVHSPGRTRPPSFPEGPKQRVFLGLRGEGKTAGSGPAPLGLRRFRHFLPSSPSNRGTLGSALTERDASWSGVAGDGRS